jgi:hypothetical protein
MEASKQPTERSPCAISWRCRRLERQARSRHTAWLREFDDRVREFTRERGGHAPVVGVTLVDGERFFLQDIAEGRTRTGSRSIPIRGTTTTCSTMRRLAGCTAGLDRGPSSIVKFELLSRPPRGTRAMVTLRV